MAWPTSSCLRAAGFNLHFFEVLRITHSAGDMQTTEASVSMVCVLQRLVSIVFALPLALATGHRVESCKCPPGCCEASACDSSKTCCAAPAGCCVPVACLSDGTGGCKCVLQEAAVAVSERQMPETQLAHARTSRPEPQARLLVKEPLVAALSDLPASCGARELLALHARLNL